MAIVIAFLVLLLVLMYLGWRARRKRQSGVAAPVSAPAELGRVLGSFGGKYVATTTSGVPLDRIAVHGLGFRGNVAVDVTATGLLVTFPDHDLWIPRADLRELRQATWTIDRVVEPGGLELVEWTLGDRPVDSYFRMEQPAAFEKAVGELTARKAA
jgi:hypothetical protein